MNNKKKLIVFSLMFILTLSFSFANTTTTVYESDQFTHIYTTLNHSTIIEFDSEIEMANLGNPNEFDISDWEKNDKLFISPNNPGSKTNLTVQTANGARYLFYLVEEDFENYNAFVHAKERPEIDHSTLIKMANQNRVEMAPHLRKVINIYDIDNRVYELNGLDMILKRAITIEGDNQSVYWFRISNGNSKDVKIPLNLISMRGREILAVAGFENDDTLKAGETADFYMIVEGAFLDGQSTIQMRVDGLESNFVLDNIPYQKREFRVFERNKGTYTNVIIGDYQN